MDELNDVVQEPQDETMMESDGEMLESDVDGDDIHEKRLATSGQLGGRSEEYMGERPMARIDDRPIELNSDSRPVKIERLSSGFLVTVGCQRVAIESTKKLTTMLAKYYENPRDFEKKWFSNDVVNRLDNII
jgi:hypothetical protein